MKRLIFSFLLLAFGFSISAQGDMSANKLFKEYKKNTNLRGGTVPGFLVKMGSWFVAADEEPELKALMSKIGSIRFLVSEENNTEAQNAFLSEMHTTLSPEYEELMTIKDGKDNYVIRVKEQNGNVKELVMLGQSDEDAMYIVIHGNIPLEEIGTLVNGISDGDMFD